ADELWGQLDGKQTTHRAVGRGAVYWGEPLAQVLAARGVAPDVDDGTAGQIGRPVQYFHRRTAAGDIYFFTNHDDTDVSLAASFRVPAASAEIWDATSGKVYTQPATRVGDRTTVSVSLAAKASMLLLFRARSTPAAAQAFNPDSDMLMSRLSGPWTL